MSRNQVILEVSELGKDFGAFRAVDSIDLQVHEREVFGFLGPNGAGKSTTINMLSTLLRPTRGRAELAGYDVIKQPNGVRQSIGMVFQDPSLDDRLTADENLRFHAMLYDVPRRVREQRTRAAARRRRTGRPAPCRCVRTFSGGMKRRLEIARGLLHHPKVLFLDEPTVGLDPQTRNAIWEHVRALRDEVGVTVFMTTHYMDEAENCDRIAVIDHGKIQALDTPAALKRAASAATRSSSPATRPCSGTSRRATGSRSSRSARSSTSRWRTARSSCRGVAVDFDGRIRSIQVKPPSLDDVFLQLTGRIIREEEGTTLDQMRQARKMWMGRR